MNKLRNEIINEIIQAFFTGISVFQPDMNIGYIHGSGNNQPTHQKIL